MRNEILELAKLGPLPSTESIMRRDDGEELLDRYARLLMSIVTPTDEEARVLVTVFGPDEGFGLAWTLIHMVETAPGWPLADCLQDEKNEWIDLLRVRLRNAGRQW